MAIEEKKQSLGYFSHHYSFPPAVDSINIRQICLMAEKPVACGTPNFWFWLNPDQKAPSLERQLAFIRSRTKDDPEFDNELEKFEKVLKATKKIKHPPAGMIMASRQAEKGITNLFKVHLAEIVEELKIAGVHQLTELVDPLDVLELCYVKNETPEQEEGEIYWKMSELILSYLKDKEDFILHQLGNQFLTAPSVIKLHTDDMMSSSIRSQIFKQKLFEIPILQKLTIPEIYAARLDLKDVFATWRNTLYKWAEVVRKLDFKEVNSTLLKQIGADLIGASFPVQQAIDKHPQILKLKQIHPKWAVNEVLAAIVPAKVLWDYYLEITIISKETHKVLMETKTEQVSPDKSYLVLINKQDFLTADLKAAIAGPQAEPIVHQRKTLDL